MRGLNKELEAKLETELYPSNAVYFCSAYFFKTFKPLGTILC